MLKPMGVTNKWLQSFDGLLSWERSSHTQSRSPMNLYLSLSGYSRGSMDGDLFSLL